MDKALVLKLPPSVNHMYVTAKIRGRNIRVLRKHANDWFNEALEKVRQYIIEEKWEMKSQKIILEIYLYYPNLKTRDSHNMLKILLDVLERGGIYSNDKYALPRIMDFTLDKSHPRIEIFFSVFNQEG
jgi:crossover junction endodeoxyribonuclease RusA